MTVYNPEWAKEFSITVSVSNDNRYSFYCIPCKKNVQCGHMVAIGDVKQHSGLDPGFLIGLGAQTLDHDIVIYVLASLAWQATTIEH